MQNRIVEHSAGPDEACVKLFGSLAVYTRIAGILACLLLKTLMYAPWQSRLMGLGEHAC